MIRSLLFFFVSCSVATAQFKNIQLAERTEGAALPVSHSIAMNAKNNKNIVVCSLGGIWYSLDGGSSWLPGYLPSRSAPAKQGAKRSGEARQSGVPSDLGSAGNEALGSDAKGNFYLIHFTGPGKETGKEKGGDPGLLCQKSTDEGKTWSDGALISNEPGKGLSQPSVSVHPRKETLVVTWRKFDPAEPNDCRSNIFFSRSTSGGKKWSKPVQLNQLSGGCLNDNNTTGCATPAIGFDGKIFVTWANQQSVFLDRSYDGGEIWLRNDLAVATQKGGSASEIPGFGRLNEAPLLMIDNSASRTHGSLNVAYSDQAHGPNDKDIWFTRSLNRGDNWTQPVRVNQDGPGKQQFLPRMAIDQTNGFIYLVYYDRREHEDLQTDVYLAYSTDGGNTFKEKKISETSFRPSLENTDVLLGSISIAANKGIVVPVWTRIDNGKISVWTAVIKQEDVGKEN